LLTSENILSSSDARVLEYVDIDALDEFFANDLLLTLGQIHLFSNKTLSSEPVTGDRGSFSIWSVKWIDRPYVIRQDSQ